MKNFLLFLALCSTQLMAQEMNFEPFRPFNPIEFRDLNKYENGINCECYQTKDKDIINLERHDVKKDVNQSQIQTIVIESHTSKESCNDALENMEQCDYKFFIE
jgi:hypothetical protein